jgi:putative spermidine/putrescine transport system permease protein
VRLVTASLAGFDRAIEEAALNLGANPWTTFWRVTLLVIRPGICRGGTVRLRHVFRNLEMSLFWSVRAARRCPSPSFNTLNENRPYRSGCLVIQILLIGAAMLATDRYVKLARVI